MGLRRGRSVEVLQKLGRTILLKLNNSRIVISKDVARNIYVE
ncbi:MAG: FeoA domain-containing protein [Hydrogenobacter sp.]